ncbi:MAG TPA: class I SAM-dependent methyltransferase [Chthonomonadaceae bacterium]|nr:class I SAM-dependent methyltransferase [Chthonomonadaceae bacterium]
MARMNSLFRMIDYCNLAALRTLVTRGPGQARKILLAAERAAIPNEHIHVMSYWDIVRAFPVEGEITLQSSGWFDGATAPLERLMMVQLLRAFQPRIIAEIGTYRGTTTRLLLDNCHPEARIYTMDLPLGQEAEALTAATDERLIVHRKVGIDYLTHPRRSQVEQIYGDSFAPDTWAKVPTGIEYAFIDASHSYEAVKNDTEWIFQKMKPNAIVLWHDYSEGETAERGVGKYIRELMRTRDDIFLCSDTDLAIRIPCSELQQCRNRVPGFFPNNDYPTRFPNGPTPWISAQGDCKEA